MQNYWKILIQNFTQNAPNSNINTARLTERINLLKQNINSNSNKKEKNFILNPKISTIPQKINKITDFNSQLNKENIMELNTDIFASSIQNCENYATFGKDTKSQNLLFNSYLSKNQNSIPDSIITTQRRNIFSGKIIKNNGILQAPLNNNSLLDTKSTGTQRNKSEIRKWREKVDYERLQKVKNRHKSCKKLVNSTQITHKDTIKGLKRELLEEKQRKISLLKQKNNLQKEIVEMSILS